MRWPGRKFAWSALSELPEVGPLGGDETEAGSHFVLFDRLCTRLEQHHTLEAVMAAPMYGGNLEFVNGHYRLSAQPGDGYVSGLPPDTDALIKALATWAVQEAAAFDPRLPN